MDIMCRIKVLRELQKAKSRMRHLIFRRKKKCKKLKKVLSLIMTMVIALSVFAALPFTASAALPVLSNVTVIAGNLESVEVKFIYDLSDDADICAVVRLVDEAAPDAATI